MKILVLALSWVALTTVSFGAEEKWNQQLLKLKPNEWFKIHEQENDDIVYFLRQAHGGSCFDAKRGGLILFGSDTHGIDWKNSPFTFNPVKLKWSRDYPDDPSESYNVTEEGLPVAGTNNNHPWAMHTFGAVIYDSARDEMLVCSHPAHMVPGRFTNMLEHVWAKVKRHPTWAYDLKRDVWTPIPCKAVSFFAHSVVYDSDRNVIVGYRPDGFYEFSGTPRHWKKIAKAGYLGWHNNSVYDSKYKAVIVYGSNENSNDIVVLDLNTGKSKKMITPGLRPPEDQHNPMAFETNIGQTAIVVDRQLYKKNIRAETWLYDLGKDCWTRIKTATFPFGCGMNYNMVYDPNHKVLLLVTGGKEGKRTTVWALKVDLELLNK